MNAERLTQFLAYLQAEERANANQQRLQELLNALSNLQSQPHQTQYQNEVVQRLAALKSSLTELYGKLTPADVSFLQEIGGLQYFAPGLCDDIAEQTKQHAMTPSVVFSYVQQLAGSRQAYLQSVDSALSGLNALGVKAQQLQPGEAEVGFLLPRDLFHNQLDNLIDELRVINRVIRFVAEAVTGATEVAQVHQLSSTDPTFFLGVNPITAATVGAVVTWALNTWKQLMEIRKVHHEVKKLELDGQIVELMEQQISKKIDDEINAKVQELIASFQGARERKNEIELGLKWSLKSVLARVERGMTVEVRFVPPPRSAVLTDGEESVGTQAVFDDLRTVSQELKFPPRPEETILELPAPEPPAPRARRAAGREPDASE